MKISKIKLNNDGLKGLTVNFLKNELKDGLTFINEHQVTYKAPIHHPLSKLIQSLAKYVIDICNLNEDAEITVTGITANDKQFLISAKSYVLENSIIAINTPNIKEGMYDAYGAIQKIIDEIYREVDIYATKKQAIDKKQFVMDLFSKDPDKLNAIDFSDPEAVKEQMIAYLEKNNCVVIEREADEEPKLNVAHSNADGKGEENAEKVETLTEGKVG